MTTPGTMPKRRIHERRNVKRFREMPGIKQDTFAAVHLQAIRNIYKTGVGLSAHTPPQARHTKPSAGYPLLSLTQDIGVKNGWEVREAA